jgi:hypothetical protein
MRRHPKHPLPATRKQAHDCYDTQSGDTREQGAQSILGLDVSEKYTQSAIEMTSDDAIVYERFDLEQIKLAEASFSLAFSSPALYAISWSCKG